MKTKAYDMLNGLYTLEDYRILRRWLAELENGVEALEKKPAPAKGDQGPRGEQGVQGPQGPPGPAVELQALEQKLATLDTKLKDDIAESLNR